MRKRSKVCFGSQYMGDDVVIQILCFMPTKSLHRFRCVSKSWNRLITHVCSRKKFRLPISGFFIDKTDDMGEYVSVTTEPEAQRFGDEFQSRIRNLPFYSTFRLIHSCNGLLLLTRRDELKSPSLYYVWNPTTMEYVVLPRVPTRAYTKVYQRYCFLAYDPRQSPHYKVVRFTLYRTCFVDIYSSRMAKWTKFNVPYELPLKFKRWADMSVFHRGALYMLYHILRYLVRFDIENMRFHLIDLPDNSLEKYIVESREHLYYAVNVHWESELKIYRLEESNKWELAHKININREVGIQHMRPIAFDPESMVIYLNKADKILSYHPCTDNFKELHVVQNMHLYRWMVFSVVPCFESINPPGGKFINPCATENVLAATSSQTPDFEIGSSSRPPQPDADDAVLAHNLQLAIEASLKSPTDLHPLICATDLDMQVVSSAIQSLGDNQDLTKIYDKTGVSQPALMKSVSISGDQRRGKAIQEITDASVTIGASGVCCRTEGSSVPSSPPSFSSQAHDNLTLTASPAELEKLLSELNGTALVPILRKNELIKSEDELSEEWADVCSKVLYVTSYLAMVKTKVRWENLASRLDNLKALKNSFDCSSLIRFFDLLMDYVQLIEKDNLDIIESNLHTSYYPSCRLLEDKKTKICEKSTLVEASACKVKSNIAKLEHELNNAQDCISDLRKRLAEEEAKVNEIHASLKTEKQKEVDLVDEKTLIDAEQAALEVQVNELEEYRVKVSVETETNLEKIKNLVKQVATSLSKFDLMGVPVSLEKE